MTTRLSELAGAVLIGLCTLGVGGQVDAQPLGALGMVEPGMVEVVVSVELSCPSCAQGLERRFSRLEHVERVEIQVDQGRVVLGLAPGTTVGVKEVWDVVRNAGFTPDELANDGGAHVLTVGGFSLP